MGELAQTLDDNHFPIPGALTPGASQDVTFDSATQSTAFPAGTRLVRLVATQTCRVAFATNPTAGAADMLIPANVVCFFKATDGQKLSALKESSSGKLNVTVFG